MTEDGWIKRKKHPFDDGYWARYDGKPRPTDSLQSMAGWDSCDAEFKLALDNLAKGAA